MTIDRTLSAPGLATVQLVTPSSSTTRSSVDASPSSSTTKSPVCPLDWVIVRISNAPAEPCGWMWIPSLKLSGNKGTANPIYVASISHSPYASKDEETSTRKHRLSTNLENPPYHFQPDEMNCLSSPVRSSGTSWPNSPMPGAYIFTRLEGPPNRIGYTLSALATVSPTACVKRSPPFGPCPWMVMVVPETDTTYTYSFCGSKVLPVSMVPTNSHCPAAMLVLAATSMVVASFRLGGGDGVAIPPPSRMEHFRPAVHDQAERADLAQLEVEVDTGVLVQPNRIHVAALADVVERGGG